VLRELLLVLLGVIWGSTPFNHAGLHCVWGCWEQTCLSSASLKHLSHLFQGMKIFFMVVAAVYILYLLFLIIRACSELRHMPYVGEHHYRNCWGGSWSLPRVGQHPKEPLVFRIQRGLCGDWPFGGRPLGGNSSPGSCLGPTKTTPSSLVRASHLILGSFPNCPTT
jgi:hypothetical protein